MSRVHIRELEGGSWGKWRGWESNKSVGEEGDETLNHSVRPKKQNIPPSAGRI